MNRPGPAPTRQPFSHTHQTVDRPLSRKAGTARVVFLAPPWN